MSPDRRAATTIRSQRVHELGLKLIALLLMTGVAFAGTRAVAVQARHRRQRDAAALHQQGVAALAAGDLGRALTSLRSASIKERGNPDYALSLARALIADGQPDPAEQALRNLREEAPDHPEVNLELARLAARRDDLEGAVRYYRYALYAPWSTADGPRRVRQELVTLLLDHQDRTRAVSELMAARSTTPDEPAAHVALGQWFMRADEPRLALEESRRALQLDAGNPAASRLAGDASFALADYASAARYLDRAGELDPSTARSRDISKAVVRLDPLASRIPSGERLARLDALVAVATERVASCAPPGTRDEETAMLRRLQQAARRPGGRDPNALEDAVGTVFDAVQPLADSCDLSAPPAQALLIIGRRQREREP